MANVPLDDKWERAGQQHYIRVDGKLELDSSEHSRDVVDTDPNDHRLDAAYRPAIEALIPCDSVNYVCD